MTVIKKSTVENLLSLELHNRGIEFNENIVSDSVEYMFMNEDRYIGQSTKELSDGINLYINDTVTNYPEYFETGEC